MNNFYSGQPVLVFSPDYDKRFRRKKKKTEKIRRTGVIYDVFTHHITVNFGPYKESFTKKDIKMGIVIILPIPQKMYA